MTRPTILDYRHQQAPRTHSAIAIVAFAAAIHPLLLMVSRTRPFWDNHPLHPIAALLQAVPFWLGPIAGFILGMIAVVEVWLCRRLAYGAVLALLAIGMSLFWVAALVYVLAAIGAGGPWR